MMIRSMYFITLIASLISILAFAPTPSTSPAFARSQIDTKKSNIVDVFSSMISNFGKKARASHILIGPREWDSEEEARAQLIRLKQEINNNPETFAEAAAKISSCPSGKKGGDLGEFGPGMMVKSFDKVVFNEDVGVVHGPISTQFGEHLILITSRTGE